MPVYQYRQVGTGQIVELVRPVAQRDAVPPGLVRITVPSRVAIAGTSSSPIDPGSADAQVRKAYRQLEETMPAAEISRTSGFSVEKIKNAWGL